MEQVLFVDWIDPIVNIIHNGEYFNPLKGQK